MYLSDLVMIDEGNPDMIVAPPCPKPLINFAKQTLYYTSINTLRQWQSDSSSESIELVDEVASLITSKRVLLSNEELYRLSLLREPRNADLSEIV